jgi:hypothetical protein
MSASPPPEGWDEQVVAPSSVEVDDEILAGHLRRRATRPVPRTLLAAIVARVDETTPERRWRLTLVEWRPRAAIAVVALAFVVVAGVVLLPTPSRIGQPPTASPAAGTLSPPPSNGVTWDPTQRALRPAEFAAVLATGPAPGTVLIVDDQIVPFLVSCGGADHCPSGELRNVPGVRIEAPPGGHLPYTIDPTIATTSITGPLALEVSPGPNLVFLGAVVGNGLRMEFLASDLVKRSAMGGLFVVPGWLWQTAVTPCASVGGTPVPMPTSELGLPAPRLQCFPTDWLTDTESTDPARGGGVGFPVQHGAHAAAAVNPGVNPSRGIYLVRDWAGYGEIVARLEPRLVPSDQASGPTVEPTVEPTVRPSPSTAGGIVMSADELVERVLSGSLKAGSIAVASIPESAVRILPPATDVPPKPRWAIASGSRYVRVDGVVASGIVGVQAFVVQPTGAIVTIGTVATGPTGAPLEGADVLPLVDGLSAVHGWLRLGPPLLCPQRPAPVDVGVFGDPLAWSQCPGTWILPSADDPWAAPSSSAPTPGNPADIGIGDLSVPAGTLHVQDRRDLGTLDPVEGVWLMRAAVSNACSSSAPCPAGNGNGIDPQPGVTWYELVGPIAAPKPAPVAPAGPLPSGIVLTQEQLIASIGSGAVPIGSLLVAKATIAPVILPSFPPEVGTVAGKIGPIRIHWASDPSLVAADLHQIALRVRPDGELDYLGPVDIRNTSADGSTNGLFLVQTLHGPMLLRRIDCDAPATIKVCPIGQADTQTVNLGPVFVPTP